LGDPSFVEGMSSCQHEMINATTAANTRSSISDYHTLDATSYNPDGLESFETWVPGPNLDTQKWG